MFRRILNFFLKKKTNLDRILLYPEGKRYYRDFHGLRREQMDYDALKVINRLNRFGYKAYLVGGCVRDMILKKNPKDFDIATNATPEQIKRIFSNSRMVGRRFRIVHILFKDDKIIEVTTFRGLPRHRLTNNKKSNLLLHRDNKYGSSQEDAARRDFTINGLYFDARNESIIDYVGGYTDIQKKYIQAVGDPNISFQEDPIRMIRAAKFAAILDFKIADKTALAIRNYRFEILKANKARLLEEIFKIFRTGKSEKIFSTLHKLELFKVIFPDVYTHSRLGFFSFEESSLGRKILVADQNLAEREQLTISIYLAIFFTDVIKEYFENPKLPNKLEFLRKKLLPICKKMFIPHKDVERIIHIYLNQLRFLRDPKEAVTRPEVFRSKIFFYEAFMYFKICAQAEQNEDLLQKAMFWEIGLRMSPPERHKAINIYSKNNIRNFMKSNPEEDFSFTEDPNLETNFKKNFKQNFKTNINTNTKESYKRLSRISTRRNSGNNGNSGNNRNKKAYSKKTN